MSDPITLYAYAAVVFAVGITLPVFAYEAYKFIDPALYPHERKAIFPFVSIVTVLFVFGAIFGFFFLAPSFIQGFIPFYTAVNALEIFPDYGFLQHNFLHYNNKWNSLHDSSVLCAFSQDSEYCIQNQSPSKESTFTLDLQLLQC